MLTAEFQHFPANGTGLCKVSTLTPYLDSSLLEKMCWMGQRELCADDISQAEYNLRPQSFIRHLISDVHLAKPLIFL